MMRYEFLPPHLITFTLHSPVLYSYSGLERLKTDSVQSSSNYLQKLFTKNLLTVRYFLECYLKHLIVIQFSK